MPSPASPAMPSHSSGSARPSWCHPFRDDGSRRISVADGSHGWRRMHPFQESPAMPTTDEGCAASLTPRLSRRQWYSRGHEYIPVALRNCDAASHRTADDECAEPTHDVATATRPRASHSLPRAGMTYACAPTCGGLSDTATRSPPPARRQRWLVRPRGRGEPSAALPPWRGGALPPVKIQRPPPRPARRAVSRRAGGETGRLCRRGEGAHCPPVKTRGPTAACPAGSPAERGVRRGGSAAVARGRSPLRRGAPTAACPAGSPAERGVRRAALPPWRGGRNAPPVKRGAPTRPAAWGAVRL